VKDIKLATTSNGSGERVDRWLHDHLPELSRSRIQALIKSGNVFLNGRPVKAHQKIAPGAEISVTVPEPEPVGIVPENIPLNILHEDNDIVVVNKPAGMVVHPGAGRTSGTLVNALLYYCGELPGIGGQLRPGIVHRLDKDTSGAIVVARTDRAMAHLSAEFRQRRVAKTYLALVWGTPPGASGTEEGPLARSRQNRQKMGVTPTGRRAVTHYETIETFGELSLLRVTIETGRTHQIRVHMSHMGHPVVGDTRYGRKRHVVLPSAVSRQMLHAQTIAFAHPADGRRVEFEAPLWEDMAMLLEALRKQ
jgi:23S rRNA pseudouridine1911/1915/1917 synthase